MGFFDRLERSSLHAMDTGTWDINDPRWFLSAGSLGVDTFAGFPIGPDTAMRVSTVFACVSLKGETLGALPCHLYRRLGDGGRERAKDHRLYRTVRQQPNAQHSAIEFFSSGEARVNMRGIALAEIQSRSSGIELMPIRPGDILQIEQLENNRLRFQVQDLKTRTSRTLLQDEVLFVRDFMEDGFAAKARVALAREAIGVAAAYEAMVGGFAKNDATGRLLITHPTALSEEKRKEFRQMIQENYAGWANRSKAMLLTNGVVATELGKHDDSGFLVDPRNFQVADIARYFGRIPLWMIGLEEKSTTWGTGIEQQKQGWIDFGMMPSIIRWEQAMNRDLLLPEEQEEYFFEFNLDGLLRGDSKTRAETNEIKKRNGAINANEWRIGDNLNPREGGDEYQDTPPGAPPNAAPPRPVPQEKARTIDPALIADAAARIVSAERGAIQRRAGKASADPEQWAAWVRKHAAADGARVTSIVAPLVAAAGIESWVVTEITARVARTALSVLVHPVPAAWLEQREGEVITIIEETLTAGAAARRAA